MPSKRKKWGKKSERRWERKRKEILLSAHARTSQANILHLDQKAAKCTIYKQLCGKKKKKKWLENRSTSFKTRFPAKFPGGRDKQSTSFFSHFSAYNNQIWPFTPVMQNSMTKIGEGQFLDFLRNIPNPGVQKRQISHSKKPIRVSHLNLLR